MIKYPTGERNVNESFLASETKRIDKLNTLFFNDVELTDNEQRVLVWLCGWDNFTIDNVISAFKKIEENKNTPLI